MTPNALVLDKIVAFIEKIGIYVDFQSISDDTFLPGLFIDKGRLVIDADQLKYVGDILHEAGHVAVMTAEERNNLTGSLEGQQNAEAAEMMVIAWTYAASLEIGIDPAIVFHADGYKGGGAHILENFQAGRYFGVPMLEWLGMTNQKGNSNDVETTIYPKMKHWVRA